jgi:MoxR-like ATPase
VDYPSYEEEVQIAETTTAGDLPKLEPVLDRATIVEMQKVVRKVLVGRTVTAYAVKLARATRPGTDEAPDFVKKYLTWGAGPRACQAMLLGAKAHAMLDGRVHVSTEDIRAVAKPVLRHRLATSFRAESDGVSADHVVEKLFEVIREPVK